MERAESTRLTAYRPFVDGMRAVSILAVVLYHVGVPGVTGGFVGVDVFFVISGFLIIAQIVEGLERGTFRLGEFWARRVYRILPTYLLVLVATAIAAPFILVMPDEFTALARQVRDAALMIVNHLFLSEQGYFDTASDEKILLHLWSLAVEEQFYLVAPVLLALLWWLPGRIGRATSRYRGLGIAAAFVFTASLAGCILFTVEGDRNYAFYLTALRAWEFVAGGAVAFLVVPARRMAPIAADGLGIAGLAAIVLSAIFYRSDLAYPSWLALVPVLGAVAVIVGGIVRPAGPAPRLLATPAMVWIGLLSYAWYLWHWPLLALARIHNIGERDFATDATLGLISLGLAAATYYLLEKPIRRWRLRQPSPPGWMPVLLAVGLAVAIAIGGFQLFRAMAKHSRSLIADRYETAELVDGQFCDITVATAEECAAMAAGRATGLLIGDSQMAYASNAVSAFAEEQGSLAVASTSPGCAAVLDTRIFMGGGPGDVACASARKAVVEKLGPGTLRPGYAILFSQWQWYATGTSFLFAPPDAADPSQDQDQAFRDALLRTVARLRSFGVERILVIGPTPLFASVPPTCLYRAERLGLDPLELCGVQRSGAEASANPAWARIRPAIEGLDDVRFVDPFTSFCGPERCLPNDGNTVYFTDTTHMSDAGTLKLIADNADDFGWLVRGDGQ